MALNTVQIAQQSDYYTQQEMAKFKYVRGRSHQDRYDTSRLNLSTVTASSVKEAERSGYSREIQP